MSPELWGGIESACVHLEDGTYDQLESTGHLARNDDLEQILDLGLHALRYPVQIDHVAPQGLDRADWSLSDERLGMLSMAGTRPVVTLLHHGTRYGNIDVRAEEFAGLIAEYAAAVATRYPWLRDYTPINEPLTTARFSCLYGHWYPHERCDHAFARAVYSQAKATVLSMQRIREVNPEARLVHTEDLGHTHTTGTGRIKEQALFENERRWLGLDLICGRVDRHHPFWPALLAAGVSAGELEWISDNPCPPDVLGCNHYPTSERVLDENLDRHPEWSHGGNGDIAYADVHVALAPEVTPLGVEQLLTDAWDRFGLPLALTEVHLDGPVDEQVAWLEQAWDTALRLSDRGVRVEAVCAWALLGCHDWNSLLTARQGHYAVGAFDIRARVPRPTPLAAAIARLALQARMLEVTTVAGGSMQARHRSAEAIR